MLTKKELTDELSFLSDVLSERKRRVAPWFLGSGWLVISQGPDAPRFPLATSSSRGLRWHWLARPLDFSLYCFGWILTLRMLDSFPENTDGRSHDTGILRCRPRRFACHAKIRAALIATAWLVGIPAVRLIEVLRGSGDGAARRRAATALVLVTLYGPTCALGAAVAPDATKIRPLEAAEPRLALSDWPGPRAQQYLPEARETRKLGDEVRDVDGCRGPLSLTVLTPPYAGVTIDGQPALFWFLGADTGARVEVELYGQDGADPLVSATYPNGLPAGFHGLALADHGVRLEADVDYEWSVAVICDPADPAGDIVSAGTIRRIAPPPDLSRRLDRARLEGRAELLVEYGIWYDALAALATLIGRHPDRARWREDRARLLEQVGLHEAAGYEP